MYNFILVFAGGGLGSLCRYGISRLMLTFTPNFPTGTLIANILSCILLGYLFGVAIKAGISDPAKLLWMTGFCGGFSTFSTFSLETFALLESGQIGYGLLNIAGSILVCLGCIYLGIKIAS